MSRIDLKQPLSQDGSGMIPGHLRTDHARYVELLRPMTIGDRVCAAGDVVSVKHPAERPRNIMPVDPFLYFDRASKLIDQKFARLHPGPATVVLGHSLRKPFETSAGDGVERQVIRDPQAERATAAPQRRGAI